MKKLTNLNPLSDDVSMEPLTYEEMTESCRQLKQRVYMTSKDFDLWCDQYFRLCNEVHRGRLRDKHLQEEVTKRTTLIDEDIAELRRLALFKLDPKDGDLMKLCNLALRLIDRVERSQAPETPGFFWK